MKLIPPKEGEKGPAGIPGQGKVRKKTSEMSAEAKSKHRSRRNLGQKVVKAAWSAVFLALERVGLEGVGSLEEALARA